ncbi:HAD family hydrolase [Neobacillus piezotolerans]|uniref:HAD family hydrolase n=1 Tax=Neobacillus piezotolerans TaxID=2259171 RepID=A0A3D8GMK4_9BACI|nr:HAD family hydrolase [Neobacillus piezotolerans]RDU35638.1 HAD family hydrolase [Neobacillus piezotolerans]
MKAIIFDFDGTLADTLPICYFAFQKVFKEYDGLDLTPDQIKAMFGPSETGIIRENLLHKSHDDAIELFYETYSQKHDELVEKNEEIASLLKQLKSKGHKLGIVTGKAKRSLDISLHRLGMEGMFDAEITGDDVEFPKPHPEGIHKALAELGVSTAEAIFLGDSDADILAGKKANVHTIGVHWLPNYQSLEFTVEPDQVFTSFRELVDLLVRLE